MPVEPFEDGRVFDWEDDPVLETEVETFARAAAREGLGTLAQEALDGAEDTDRTLYTVLRGLDRALAAAHPHLCGTRVASAALLKAQLRYSETGRLNAASPGVLLPRFTHAPNAELALEHPRDAFSNVVHVEQDAFDGHFDQVLLAGRNDPGRLKRERLTIGSAPMFETLDEVDLKPSGSAMNRRYRLAPKTDAELVGRAREMLIAFDAKDAVLGVVPEATLDDKLLAAWHEAIDEVEPGRSSLSWILVGSGPIGGPPPAGKSPPNRAVVIDRQTNEVIATQDKRFRFTLNSKQIQTWRLTLDAERATEDIALGARTVFLECPFGRVAIAICEDAARFIDVAEPLRDIAVSLLLVPVFSKELREHYWEDAAAKSYASGMGAMVVVANSLAVARARRDQPGDGDDEFVDDSGWGTVFARTSSFQIGRSADACDVKVLKLDSLPAA